MMGNIFFNKATVCWEKSFLNQTNRFKQGSTSAGLIFLPVYSGWLKNSFLSLDADDSQDRYSAVICVLSFFFLLKQYTDCLCKNPFLRDSGLFHLLS